MTIVLGGDSINNDISPIRTRCHISIMFFLKKINGHRDVGFYRMTTLLGIFFGLSFSFCLLIAIMFVMLCSFGFFFYIAFA